MAQHSPRRTRLTSSLLAITLMATGGCASLNEFFFGPQPVPDESSQRRSLTYSGPECGMVWTGLMVEGRAFEQVEDDSPETQILLYSCATSRRGVNERQFNRIIPTDPQTLYFAIDDRALGTPNFDPLPAALAAVAIGTDEFELTSTLYVGDEERRDEQVGLKHAYTPAVSAGWIITLSSLIERDALAAAVGSLELPPDAGQAFLAVYDDVVAHAMAVELEDDVRYATVDVPKHVIETRHAHFVEFEAYYQELDEQLAVLTGVGVPTDEQIEALRDLRARFMKECGTHECQRWPVWASLTESLARAHVARGEVFDARVESLMQMERDSYRPSLAHEIAYAQNADYHLTWQARQNYQEALRAGHDETAALELAGVRGTWSAEGFGFPQPSSSLPDFSRSMSTPVNYPVNYEVERVKKAGRGPLAIVEFKSITEMVDKAYGCRRTNRVSQITSSGRVIYDEKCKWKKVRRKRAVHPPVLMPTSETRWLERGDDVHFILFEKHEEDGEGRIQFVKRDDQVVQVRGDTLRDG